MAKRGAQAILLRKRRILSAPCLSRRRMPQLYGKATGKQRPLSLRPGGRGLIGRDGGSPSCPGADDGRMDMDAWTCLLLFLLSSLLLGFCPYLSGTMISLLDRLTPFFLFWRGLMESRFNYNFIFGCVSLSGDMSCVGVDRSRTITIFVAQSDLRSR